MKRINKAVFPVAGLGTRVLPGAKTTPKNLLNVVDRPILSYVVEEARAAGIEHFVFIVGRGQGAIEDYFDANPEVEGILEASLASGSHVSWDDAPPLQGRVDDVPRRGGPCGARD